MIFLLLKNWMLKSFINLHLSEEFSYFWGKITEFSAAIKSVKKSLPKGRLFNP